MTFDSMIYCGTCFFCRRGQINLCDRRRVLGVACPEFRQEGAFAEFVAVPQHILYRLPDGLSFERAAMVEPLSVAFHAVAQVGVQLNDTAVVVGAGMIGLLCIQTLRAAGCGRIIAVDVDRAQLDLACRLGADEAVSAKETDPVGRDSPPHRRPRRRSGRRGRGLSGDAGHRREGRPKGRTRALVGNLAPQVELPLQTVVTRELTLFGSCASAGEYPACLDMIARGTIDVDALTSAVAPLGEGAAWFQRLHKGGEGLMKVILVP